MHFATHNPPTNILYKNSKILKFTDGVKLKNFHLVLDDINKKLPTALQNIFIPAKETHNYQTRGSTLYKMSLPKIKKVTYGGYSIN